MAMKLDRPRTIKNPGRSRRGQAGMRRVADGTAAASDGARIAAALAAGSEDDFWTASARRMFEGVIVYVRANRGFDGEEGRVDQ
jgi:hypothetical protein